MQDSGGPLEPIPIFGRSDFVSANHAQLDHRFMSYVPAVSSILSPAYLAEFVRQKYKVASDTRCRIIRIGANHTYLITSAAERYVLRVYARNWRTELEISEELRLLDLLQKNNFSVSHPIPDVNGQYIQQMNALEGLRFAVLFSYAEGAAVKNLSKEACSQLGTTMARLHQQTVDLTINRKDYTADTLVRWAFDLAKGFFGEASEDIQFFSRAQAVIAREFGQIDPRVVRHGVVHLDIWQDNMKVSEDHVVSLFDFDNCGNGPLFLDLGYTLMSLYRHEPNKEQYREKRELFLQAYRSTFPFSQVEEKLIPYGGLAIWLHYNGVHVQRFDDFSNPFLSPTFLTYWINTARQWMAFHDIQI